MIMVDDDRKLALTEQAAVTLAELAWHVGEPDGLIPIPRAQYQKENLGRNVTSLYAESDFLTYPPVAIEFIDNGSVVRLDNGRLALTPEGLDGLLAHWEDICHAWDHYEVDHPELVDLVDFEGDA